MKYIYTILFILIIPFNLLGQDNKVNDKKEDVVISINISKISNTLGNIVGFFKSEVNEYKKDIDECLPEEKKNEMKKEYEEVKGIIKKGFKDCIKEAHRGFRQGLRGEDYDPNKD